MTKGGIGVTVDGCIIDWLNRITKKTGKSRSYVVNECLLKFVKTPEATPFYQCYRCGLNASAEPDELCPKCKEFVEDQKLTRKLTTFDEQKDLTQSEKDKLNRENQLQSIAAVEETAVCLKRRIKGLKDDHKEQVKKLGKEEYDKRLVEAKEDLKEQKEKISKFKNSGCM